MWPFPLPGSFPKRSNRNKLRWYWNIWEIRNYRNAEHSLKKTGDLVSFDSGTSYNPPVKIKLKSI
jgi:hypothetical protein